MLFFYDRMSHGTFNTVDQFLKCIRNLQQKPDNLFILVIILIKRVIVFLNNNLLLYYYYTYKTFGMFG